MVGTVLQHSRAPLQACRLNTRLQEQIFPLPADSRSESTCSLQALLVASALFMRWPLFLNLGWAHKWYVRLKEGLIYKRSCWENLTTQDAAAAASAHYLQGSKWFSLIHNNRPVAAQGRFCDGNRAGKGTLSVVTPNALSIFLFEKV